MGIPDFIDRYHLPDGDHLCTLEEIEEYFLFTEKRREKWQQFKMMLDRMCFLGLKPDSILINGSFVTGREEPGDVDFAALIKPDTVLKAIQAAEDDHDKDGIHLFLNPKNQGALRNLFGAHLLLADSEQSLTGWSLFFRKGQNGKLREPDPNKDPEWVKRPESKGILKINIE